MRGALEEEILKFSHSVCATGWVGGGEWRVRTVLFEFFCDVCRNVGSINEMCVLH